MTRTVTLLGPQRRPSVQLVLRDLPADADVATVTAGWLEREADDGELRELLGRRGANLALHARWLDVLERDREFAHAQREHDAGLAELRRLYLVQLDHALNAAYAIAADKEPRPRFRETALGDAIDVVRQVDAQHLTRVRTAHQAFFDAWPPQDRPVVAQHRAEVAAELQKADAVVISGGYVGELTKMLHLFLVEPHLPSQVIAWSAGAMALAERVVLFHDFVAHGVAQTEVFGQGLGVVPDLVPLPHLRRRLRVDDRVRMSVLARRFAPAGCLALEDGARVTLSGSRLPAGARLVGADGRIIEVEAA